MAVCQYDRYEWDGVTDVIIWISISCWHCDRYASKFQCKTQPNRTTKKFFIRYTHWTRLKKKKPWSNCTTFLPIQVTTRKIFRWPSFYACSNFFLGDQLNKIFRLVEFDSLIESKCKKKETISPSYVFLFDCGRKRTRNSQNQIQCQSESRAKKSDKFQTIG